MTVQDLVAHLSKVHSAPIKTTDGVYKAWCCKKCGKPVDAVARTDWDYYGWAKVHRACRAGV